VGAFTVGFDDETLECCSDHLERYVMNRLAPVAFAITETSVEDAILCRRMQLLSFLRPQVSSLSLRLYSYDDYAGPGY
jgi:hypothetical protein